MKDYDKTKHSFRANWAMDHMVKALNEYKAEADKYKAAAKQDFKIFPFKSYLINTVELTWKQKKGDFYGPKTCQLKGDNHFYDHELGETEERLKELKAQDEEIYKENVQIAQNNLVAYNNLMTLISNMGIKTTRVDTKSRKFIKPDVTCDFVQEIRNNCYTSAPQSPSYRWDGFIASLKKQLEEKVAAVRAIEKKKAVEIKEETRIKLFVDLVKKYNCDFPRGIPSADEMLDVILAKDKYLRLGHYLALNHGDWNDGYSYAETGLRNFEVVTEEDKEIDAEISSYFEDFSDGRVFRDCHYNYDYLFSKVTKDLMEDYSKVKEYVELY